MAKVFEYGSEVHRKQKGPEIDDDFVPCSSNTTGSEFDLGDTEDSQSVLRQQISIQQI